MSASDEGSSTAPLTGVDAAAGTRAPSGPRAPADVVAGVRIERDVEMAVRDGTVLRADVYRPAEPSRDLPVLLMRTPYSKQMADDASYQHPAWYVREGFIVVVQDVRGRGASDGTFRPFADEPADGYDSVEWAARLPGANGRVGLYGASYPGLVQLQAAVERPPSLGAIAPAVTAADLYAHWTYEGGALHLAFTAWWAASLASAEAVRAGDTALAAELAELLVDPSAWFTSAAPADLEPLASRAPWYLDWLDHATDDGFWAVLSPRDRLDRVAVPALHIAGWFDIFLAGGIDAFRRLTALGAPDQRLLVGPWMHYPWGGGAWELRSSASGQGSVLVDRAQVAFMRRHLDPKAAGAGGAEGTGAAEDGTAGAAVRYHTLFADRWAEAPTWPPPDAVERSLYLASDGSANAAGGDGRLLDEPPATARPDMYEYKPFLPVPSRGGHSCCFPGRSPMGVAEQGWVEDLTQVLVYTSEPLDSPLTIAGEVRVELWVATDAPSADYVARLCVVDERGSWNLVDGMTRVPDTTLEGPGEPMPVTISLRSIAARIEAGRRLRLHVTSGSSPTWSTNPQTGAPPERTAPADGRSALHVVSHDATHPSRLVIGVLPA